MSPLPRNHLVWCISHGPFPKAIHNLRLFNEGNNNTTKNLKLMAYYIKSHRMLRMMETGLVNHWEDIYLPKPIQCMTDPSSRQAIMADIRNPALVDLVGLVPAFAFLLIGCIFAFVVLLTEWIRKYQLWRLFPLFRSSSQSLIH